MSYLSQRLTLMKTNLTMYKREEIQRLWKPLDLSPHRQNLPEGPPMRPLAAHTPTAITALV